MDEISIPCKYIFHRNIPVITDFVTQNQTDAFLSMITEYRRTLLKPFSTDTWHKMTADNRDPRALCVSKINHGQPLKTKSNLECFLLHFASVWNMHCVRSIEQCLVITVCNWQSCKQQQFRSANSWRLT